MQFPIFSRFQPLTVRRFGIFKAARRPSRSKIDCGEQRINVSSSLTSENPDLGRRNKVFRVDFAKH